MSTYNLCLEQKYEKYQNFFYLKVFFFGGKVLNIFVKVCLCNAKRVPFQYFIKDYGIHIDFDNFAIKEGRYVYTAKRNL